MESERDLRGPACGVLAAALFGVAAPFGKALLSHAGPVALASVFYLSAGVVLCVVAPLRRDGVEAPLRRGDAPLLAAIAALGGIVGPVLMLLGLARVSGVAGSLLLNLEAPATILLAVAFFGEHLGRREAVGAAFVVAGAALLAIPSSSSAAGGTAWGALAIAGACLAWGIDNNLTQRLSLRDPIALVRWKTLAAGVGGAGIALAIGDRFPTGSAMTAAAVVGATSYGVSIVLDAYALRFVGAAREATYFATAPFFGALAAVPVLGERIGIPHVVAAAAMAWGTSRLVRERHGHRHVHEAVTHEHSHVHDPHHQHEHAADAAVDEPHSHVHTHAVLVHDHPHVPDAHHRHRH